MGLLNDSAIRQRVLSHNMISPFESSLVSQGVISYGLSSYGYDMRVGNKFKLFVHQDGVVIDPKNIDARAMVNIETDVLLMPPHSFALAVSIERFIVPRNVSCICLGKSTYARCGAIVNITPLEAGWQGYVTIEISNTTPLPLMVYANEGIAQVLFFEGDAPPQVSYADRKGKYQDQQAEVTLPVVK